MPYARIATKQALYAIGQLHSELAGKLVANTQEHKRLTLAMLQVEAVMKMLALGFNLKTIAVRRRKPDTWFASITNKLARGTFAATFFLACLAALELDRSSPRRDLVMVQAR
jgi:hypothetical protein